MVIRGRVGCRRVAAERAGMRLLFSRATRPDKNWATKGTGRQGAENEVLAIMPPIVHWAWDLVKKAALMMHVTQTCGQRFRVSLTQEGDAVHVHAQGERQACAACMRACGRRSRATHQHPHQAHHPVVQDGSEVEQRQRRRLGAQCDGGRVVHAALRVSSRRAHHREELAGVLQRLEAVAAADEFLRRC